MKQGEEKKERKWRERDLWRELGGIPSIGQGGKRKERTWGARRDLEEKKRL